MPKCSKDLQSLTGGVTCYIGCTIVFSRLLDNLACLTMWSMTGTHVSLQSSGLNFGIPVDLVLSLVVPTIPKLMVRLRGNTECWNKLLDVYWLTSPCLKQNGIICCIMWSLLSTQP